MNYAGAAASGEVQSERLLLARPSVSVVACLLDPLIKYLCCQSQPQPRKGRVATRLAMALAGCAQRSGSLSMTFTNNYLTSRHVYLSIDI